MVLNDIMEEWLIQAGTLHGLHNAFWDVLHIETRAR